MDACDKVENVHDTSVNYWLIAVDYVQITLMHIIYTFVMYIRQML